MQLGPELVGRLGGRGNVAKGQPDAACNAAGDPIARERPAVVQAQMQSPVSMPTVGFDPIERIELDPATLTARLHC
ncbi:MAG: hypothetical protein ACHP83_00865 [Burkholderiales bacterium]